MSRRLGRRFRRRTCVPSGVRGCRLYGLVKRLCKVSLLLVCQGKIARFYGASTASSLKDADFPRSAAHCGSPAFVYTVMDIHRVNRPPLETSMRSIAGRLLASVVMILGFLFVLSGFFEFALIMILQPSFSRSWSSLLQMLLGSVLVLVPLCCVYREIESGAGGPTFRRPLQRKDTGPFIWASCTFDTIRHRDLEFAHVCVKQGRAASQWARSSPASALPGIDVLSDGTCLCCLEDFEPRSKVAVLPCGHVYHEECIAQWSVSFAMVAAASCPSCRGRYGGSE